MLTPSNPWLVVSTPLKNISWDDYSQYLESQKFHGSKPPTRILKPSQVNVCCYNPSSNQLDHNLQ